MDQLLVALDVDSARSAIELADVLRDIAGGFKIGSRLFTAEGPAIVRSLVERGDRVFLDLKFHDIPNTVAGAVAEATKLGVWMVDVHASGGRAMMEAAHRAAGEVAAARGRPRPLVIAVTTLTSLDEPALRATGVARPLLEHVVRLAEVASDCGLDGVVASPLELGALRRRFGESSVLVTPGIRDEAARAGSRDDQQRTLTARKALDAGASYIVVDRPVIGARDPRAAAERLVREARG